MDVVGTRRHQGDQLDAELGNALQQPLGAGLAVASVRRRLLLEGFPGLQEVGFDRLELQGHRFRVLSGLGRKALGMEHLRAVVSFGGEDPEEVSVGALELADGRKGRELGGRTLEEARQVRREPVRRRSRERARKPMRRRIFESMGLVHDQVVVFGQHLTEVRLAHDQIGNQQMMVHDQDLARVRGFPQGGQVTLLVMGTAAPDAVLGNGRDAPPVLRRSPESPNLVAISSFGLLRPGGNPPEIGAAPGIEFQVPFRLEFLPLQTAEIVLPSLHAGHRDPASQNALELGQILVEELVLKVLGRRRDNDPLPAEQRRDEIGERLSDAGSRLDHQRTVSMQRLFDARRHLYLSGPVFEAGQRFGQHPVGAEEIGCLTHSRLPRRRLNIPDLISAQGINGRQKIVLRILATGRRARTKRPGGAPRVHAAGET